MSRSLLDIAATQLTQAKQFHRKEEEEKAVKQVRHCLDSLEEYLEKQGEEVRIDRSEDGPELEAMQPGSYTLLDDEDLLSLLRQFMKELGHVPSSKEVAEDDRMPSPSTYHRHFGAWKEVLKEVGADPTELKRRHAPKSMLEKKLEKGDAGD